MSLTDRVAELRAGQLTTGSIPGPSPRDLLIATERQRILETFQVQSKLVEVRDKYWRCGDLLTLPNGFQLQAHWTEARSIIHSRLKITPGDRGYQEDFTIGNTRHFGSYHPPTSAKSEWVEHVENLVAPVHHSIGIQVLEGTIGAKTDEVSSDPPELYLAIVIGIDPKYRNLPFWINNTLRPTRLNLSDITRAIDDLSGRKYNPSRNHELANMNGYDRDFIQHPFTPWAVFSGRSEVGQFDDFLAQYIIDAGFDKKPLFDYHPIHKASSSLEFLLRQEKGYPARRWLSLGLGPTESDMNKVIYGRTRRSHLER